MRTQVELAGLLHALEVQHAELHVQHVELAASAQELRRTNSELTFACERYRIVHTLAPAPLITVDPAGLVVELNHAGCTLLGVGLAHVIGRRLAVFVAEDHRNSLRHHLATLFAGEAVGTIESRLVVDGRWVDVLIDAVLLPDVGRTQAVLSLVDVTARKRDEATRGSLARRSEEQQRISSLGVLASGIAHDFNNLLTVVLASAEHVLHGLAATSPAVEPLQELRIAARRAADLAHKMLAYSGQASSLVRATDVSALLHDAEADLHTAAGTVPLELDIPSDLPWVGGDPAQLRQILLNLVTNAAEAMAHRPGAIHVAGRRARLHAEQLARIPLASDLLPGAYLVLEVRDLGAGMDGRVQARAFEPYFSTKFAGRGLGLAVVQGIVRSHHGTVTIESSPGFGSTFRVYLPVVAAEHGNTAAGRAAGNRRAATTLLVVDDEPLIQRATARLCRSLGFVTLTASGGDEAIEIVRTADRQIDLVLMDLTMPDMGGVATTRALLELRPDLPVLLVTGYGEIPASANSLFVGLLTKPFDVPQLRAAIDQVLSPTGATAPGPASS